MSLILIYSDHAKLKWTKITGKFINRLIQAIYYYC